MFSEWVDGEFFVNTVNDNPTPFNISSPQDGVWVDSFTPLLSVTNSQDPDHDAITYGFAVFHQSDGSTPVASTEGVQPGTNSTTEWRVDVNLLENNWYRWRAVATDEHGAQTMSDEANIFVNTVNDAPTAPELVAPANCSELEQTSVTLVIRNGTDPDSSELSYLLEIDTAPTFDSENLYVAPARPQGDETTQWGFVDLLDNTRYYWRVKTSDGHAESAWMQGEFFVNTANDAPTVPAPNNPGNNSWVGTLTPTLSVYPSSDIDFDTLSYEFEVYDAWGSNKRVGRLVASGASDHPYWQITENLRSGWFFWRVRAIDEHGLASDWSDYVLFLCRPGWC